MDTAERRFKIHRKPVPDRSTYSTLPPTHSGYAIHVDVPFQVKRDQEQAAWFPGRHQPQYEQLSRASKDEHRSEPKRSRNYGAYRPSGLFSSAKTWTHPVILVEFCVIFAAMLAAILILHHYSQKNNGFSIGKSTSSYTWKYGPTAVLTIAIALWRQVDQSYKVEAPWIQMSSGYSSAKQSVLLDYTSPILPVAFVSSIRNRHWRVTASITVLALLKIAVLLSTGLLVLQNTTLTRHDVPISLEAGPKETLLYRENEANSPYYINEYWGIIEKGLPYPARTSASAAFQDLAITNRFPSGARVTAEVLAFFPNLECEVASIEHKYTTDYYGDHYVAFNFTSKSCYGSGPSFTICDPSSQNCTSLDYYGSVFYYDCPAFGGPPTYWGELPGDLNTFFFALVAVSSQQDFAPGNSSDITASSQSISWTSGALCRSTYSVEKANLFVDLDHPKAPGGTILSLPITNTGNIVPGYTYSNLTADIAAIESAGDGSVAGGAPSSSSAVSYNLNAWFNLMLIATSTTDVANLRNASLLIESATTVFQGLAATWVGSFSWLSSPEHLSTIGSYQIDEQRLHIQLSSVWGMNVVLALAITLVLLMLIVPNPSDHACRPDMFLSQVLQASARNDLFDLLADYRNASNTPLEHHLFGSTFATVPDSRSLWRIKAKFSQASEASQLPGLAPKVDSESNWWTPISTRRLFAILALLVPVSVIIVLEVLQRVSDKHQGVCDVMIHQAVAQVLISLIPAAVMLGTAAIYSSIEWGVRTFAPFDMMKKGYASLRSINYCPLGELPPVVVIQSIKRRQYAVLMIVISATLGSVLTIIVSGLFSIQDRSKAYTTFLKTTGQFNLTWNGTQDMGGGNMFSLIQNHNASFPPGTFDEVAFPMLAFNGSDRGASQVLEAGISTHVSISMPITRSSLKCTVVPKENMTYKLNPSVSKEGEGYASYLSPTANVTVFMELPQECQFSSGIWQNVSRLRLESQILMPNTVNPGDVVLGAQILSLGTLENPAIVSSTEYSSNDAFLPPRCPSIAFLSGKFSNDTSTDDKTVLVCSQYQEEVPALVSFNVPGLSLDTKHPLQLDESNAMIVANTQYAMAELFVMRLEYAYSDQHDIAALDDFYDAVVAYLGVPIKEIIGDGNEERFFDVTQHLYRQFMAQIINDAMRIESNSTTARDDDSAVTQIGTRFAATIFDPNRLRMYQNNISKIVLQAVLATMVVCFIAAYVKIDMRRTLPHNPCTIAGSMSLLVGSDFLKEVGRMIHEDGDIEQVGERLGNAKLRLGWWPEHAAAAPFSEERFQGKPARYGIDIVK